MFSIPSAAALGLCRHCSSVFRSIWKPTASPALPIGGIGEGTTFVGCSLLPGLLVESPSLSGVPADCVVLCVLIQKPPCLCSPGVLSLWECSLGAEFWPCLLLGLVPAGRGARL